MSRYRIECCDCRDGMAAMEPDSVDAVVCDPPYGLSFMGKGWDRGVPRVEFWDAAKRVAKPGAHLLAFGGTRTFHRLACAIEDAGWEIRDCVMWVYGSGFPKSLNLKEEWSGWGTALKPAWEPVVVARKPFEGTVADNVLRHRTGAMNIDGCRVGSEERAAFEYFETDSKMGYGGGTKRATQVGTTTQGRWPANVIHDGSDEVVGPMGIAARFFYCAKASKRDRDEGCEGFEVRTAGECTSRTDGSAGLNSPRAEAGRTDGSRNHHPTVKPSELMRYLCRLVTPPGGVVLDPFMGSGSTGKAALMEGFRFVGFEMDPDYAKIAEARIEHVVNGRLAL